MGRMSAESMKEVADDMGISLRQQLSWHLTSNHYPPVPTSMIEPCIEAIEAVREGDHEREIALPEGVSWRGQDNAPAHAIVIGHHLDAWCYEDDYTEDMDA